MKNFTTWNAMNPLTLRIKGTGEYVAKECANLVNTWEDAMADNYEANGDTEYHNQD